MHKDETWQVYAPNGEPIKGKGWDFVGGTILHNKCKAP